MRIQRLQIPCLDNAVEILDIDDISVQRESDHVFRVFADVEIVHAFVISHSERWLEQVAECRVQFGCPTQIKMHFEKAPLSDFAVVLILDDESDATSSIVDDIEASGVDVRMN